MNEIRDVEKQISDGIDKAQNQLVVDAMVSNHAKAQAAVEQLQTEFVTLVGEPWFGDPSDLIQLQCRVGSSIDGPFTYQDRLSRVNVMKRSEFRANDDAAIEATAAVTQLSFLRGHIDELSKRVIHFRKLEINCNEARANLTLAYRHLEDARMRLGKAIQAIDGGVSCYDKNPQSV